jgi:predicted ATPase/class 3 adenylate cyclase/DNA-binding CsgD family transcriptional regulator
MYAVSRWVTMSGVRDASGTVDGEERRASAALVTFLLGDIEGSTALWDAAPDAAAEAVARFRQIVGEAVVAYGGVQPLEQGEGDSFVAAFDRPLDALRCAVVLQRQLATEVWPGDLAMRVRTGVHTGEALVDADARYSGPVLNRCARIRDLGHGGQILVSAATYELASDALSDTVELRPVGEVSLRGLSRPERIWQLCHPDLPDRFPPLAAAADGGGTLPVALTSFVGRQHDLAAVGELVASSRLVTLTGAGGCGKTRLAIEAARRRSDGLCWFADLSGLGDGDLVPTTVAVAVGAPLPPHRAAAESLREYLKRQAALVVVDNCEHVVDTVAALVSELLAAAPEIRVVATSREPLGVAGEVVYRVPSLPVGSHGELGDAAVLFQERAAAVRPGFVVDDATRDAVIAICRRVDGIPLAIELAAAQMRLLGPAELAADLDRGFGRLVGTTRNALARQQTLDASVGWSYGLLDADAQTVLQRLSVFAGGFDLDAAFDVCAGGTVDSERVPQLLARLVDCSLVDAAEDERGSTRLRLLEAVRSFAHGQLVDDDDTRRRHGRYFARRADIAGRALELDGQREWGARLEVDLDNYRAAIDWASGSHEAETAAQIAAGLWLVWAKNRLREGREHLDRVLAAAGISPRTEGRARFARGDLCLLLGDLAATRADADRLIELAATTGDRWWSSRALNLHAWVDYFSGDPGAYARFERAAELHREVDDSWCLSDTLLGFGMIAMARGDASMVESSLTEAISVARAAGNEGNIQRNTYLLGLNAALQGRVADSRAALAESIALGEGLEETTFTTMAQIVSAHLDGIPGKSDDAAERIRTLAANAADAGNFLAVSIAAPLLADLAWRRGALDPEDATNASEASARVGIYVLVAFTLERGAQAALDNDDEITANDLAARALDAARRANSHWMTAKIQLVQARLSAHDGDLRRAEQLAHEALATLLDSAHVVSAVEGVEYLASFAARQHKGPFALRLFAAADAARARLDYPRGSRQETHVAVDTELAQNACANDDEIASALADGHAMTLPDAITYAQRGRGRRGRPQSGWGSLTPTEQEVVRLVSQGLRNVDVAERLFISPGTVKVHLTHIFNKVGVANRTQLVASAATHEHHEQP